MSEQELQREIERTRQCLGETVDALAAKADIKARVRAKAAEAKARARDRVAEVSEQARGSQIVPRYWPVAMTACGLVIGAAGIWQWRKQP